jgi:DNA-binding response OmpR family regulator
MHILIVDDERPLAEALAQILSEQDNRVDLAYDGVSALEKARSTPYDVIILDVMLPQMDGFTVCRTLRSEENTTPILMLTARDDVTDKVTGLDCGADDYMTKPFAPEELSARLRALTRRQGEVVLEELTFSDLHLGLFNRMLSCGSKSVHLGFKEFDVLRVLMTADGNVVSKEELLNRVWGTNTAAEDNNVEAYISFLRKKLFYLESQVVISTVRRLGYYLEYKPV